MPFHTNEVNNSTSEGSSAIVDWSFVCFIKQISPWGIKMERRMNRSNDLVLVKCETALHTTVADFTKNVIAIGMHREREREREMHA